MMPSHEPNEVTPATGAKRKYLNNWVEALAKYQRPFKVAHTREDTMSAVENHSKGVASPVHDGPMPNLIDPANANKNNGVSNNESNNQQNRSKKNKSGSSNNKNKQNQQKTVIDLSNDSSIDNINGNERYATSSIRDRKGITYYSIAMGDNGDQRGSNFTPLKLEPFEMPPTYTSSKGSNNSSNKKLVITVSDTKNALKKAAKRARKKARKELQKELEREKENQKITQRDESQDDEPITIEDDSNESGMLKRAIERSKNDIGILKRRDAPRSDDPGNKRNETVNNNDYNGTLMPRRVRELLASDSDVTEDEEERRRHKKLAEIAKLALDAANKQQNFRDDITLSNSNDSSHKSSKSKKRKHTERQTQENEQQSSKNSKQLEVQEIGSDAPSDVTLGKAPKLVDKNQTVKSLRHLQCSFVDGLKGRCASMGNDVYCEKHLKVVRDVEAAFDNLNQDVVNHDPNFSTLIHMPTTNDKSVKKRPFPKKSHGLTLENRDILLCCLDKIKKLDAQESSFNEKGKLVLSQIKSLNRLLISFDKQRRGVCEEKHRLIDTLSTLVTSWTPMFVDVNDSSELIGFDSVVKNQRVINKILSSVKEPIVEEP